MKPNLYTSAMRGDVADLEQHKDVLEGELTPNHNTVLHVAVQFGHLDYVKVVLEACPSLLCRRNVKGETPLHMAARDGQAEIVEALIILAKETRELESGWGGVVKEMLRATNVDGDTALHMAARNCHLELGVRAKGRRYGDYGDWHDRATVEDIMSLLTVDREKAEEIMRAIKVNKEEVEEIMRATEVDRDTALHKATRNRLEKDLNRDSYLEVVKLLSKEDAEFQHLPNKFQETPLYLAAERGIMGVAIVDTLVETYKNNQLTYSGPYGRTALHAAALEDFTGRSTKKLLEWKKDLINQADEYGWIPLRYATCNGNKEGVKELLAMDGSQAYITTTNKGDQDTATSNGNENGVRELLVMDESGPYITITNKDDLDKALHIAAAYGHEHVIEELLRIAPDCWEMVNSKGQNALHIAVDMKRNSVIRYILGKSWVGQLINQKDNKGNTPLHLLIASDCNAYDQWELFRMEQLWEQLWEHHRADHHAFNGKNMTPVDLVWSDFMEERMSAFAERYIVFFNAIEDQWDLRIGGVWLLDGQWVIVFRDDIFLFWGITAGGGRNLACNSHVTLAKLEKARTREKQKKKEAKEKENKEAFELSVNLFQTIVIVAALIATITFAAAFTIPGGYDGNQGRDQGMAILSRAAAFKAFVITNTIAMVCSITSIFLCLTAMGYSLSAVEKAIGYYKIRYAGAVGLIIVSMFFLMIAFITATFAVLAHAIALAVSTCIIACFAFIGYVVELGKFIARFDRLE
ncbi:hypothetical protein RHSIM_Rhsim04G0191900 [Rhododendron simsii]|uniref:PGG domain-containing protein n=1 Tax=Rhododendron simsii TaxID=118357 RepID=A0A834H082_RHOSS|nr:hypothetical protein RHSIM_Rhsim04G0191900 [Rhododendron simsii]